MPRRAIACLAALTALGGCAARRPMAYQLRPEGEQVTLLPPNPIRQSAPETYVIQVKKARSKGRRQCDVPGDALRLRWKGRNAEVTAKGVATDQSGRVVLTVLNEVDRFRHAIAGLESRGCLQPGESGQVLARVAEELPLPSGFAFELRNGSSPALGYVDVREPFQLKIVSAVRESGAIAGFEEVRYAARRGQLSLLSVEITRAGKAAEPARQPRQTYFTVPASARHLRLFFLTRKSAADHDAILLAAEDAASLAVRTEGIRKSGEEYCRKEAQIVCLTVPRDAAMSAEVPVTANSKAIAIPVRGTVRDVLRRSGVTEPERVRATLKVQRPYAGKLIPVEFDVSRRDILGLVLIGDEEISW